jgi:hypothetical protein
MGLFDRLFGRTPPKAGPPHPPRCAGNPGEAVEGSVEFTAGERSWTESFHVVALASRVLRARGHDFTNHETWLELRPSGFIVQPRLVDMQLLDDGGLRTTTTMDVRHPQLVPGGLFEYQHATGGTIEEALASGFESWESLDLAVLLDALRPQPEDCTLLEMQFPEKDGAPARTRRAVLGAVAHSSASPAVPGETAAAGEEQCERDHPFCACCFLTRNHDTFLPHLQSDEFLGIRFYAMRNEDGTPEADCRLNGEDYEPGMASLRDYVATWPGSGFEFRKQYVVLHTPHPPHPSRDG